ncbi:unnamed protein product [Amoebophrya sp. A25]|nr:unnamed protein product [Amoebophrya sp. A25]|eukprot:GSA25T00018898001.1
MLDVGTGGYSATQQLNEVDDDLRSVVAYNTDFTDGTRVALGETLHGAQKRKKWAIENWRIRRARAQARGKVIERYPASADGFEQRNKKKPLVLKEHDGVRVLEIDDRARKVVTVYDTSAVIGADGPHRLEPLSIGAYVVNHEKKKELHTAGVASSTSSTARGKSSGSNNKPSVPQKRNKNDSSQDGWSDARYDVTDLPRSSDLQGPIVVRRMRGGRELSAILNLSEVFDHADFRQEPSYTYPFRPVNKSKAGRAPGRAPLLRSRELQESPQCFEITSQ